MALSLRPWNERPADSASMLNPALIATVVAWAAARHRTSSPTRQNMPWELAFLVVPMSFHRVTRAALPSTTRTHFAGWLNDHQDVLAGFPDRARRFAPHVREGLRYGMRSRLISVTGDGNISARIPGAVRRVDDGELRDMLTAAAVLGGWFARAGTPASVFTFLGVTP